MCFTDAEPPEFCEERIQRTLRDRKCHECHRVIGIGEQYHSWRGKWDGRFQAFAVCRECEFDRNRIINAEVASGCASYEAFCPFGMLREYMQDVGMEPTEPGMEGLGVS